MKRNRSTVRQGRYIRTKSGHSSYKEKKDSGKMMYGPGCCAHKITDGQIAAAKRRAREEGHHYISSFDPIYQRAHSEIVD